jgi:hypothetical protein
MPEAQTADQYINVADARITDARALFDAKRYEGAFYLSGYGVECSLKALLLDRTTVAQYPKMLRFCRGKSGHELNKIKERLRKRGVEFPRTVARAFASVRTWSVGLRYNTDDRTRHATSVMLRSVDIVAT